MYLYELKYRVNNYVRCFDKRVLVLAEHLYSAKSRAEFALKQAYGNSISLKFMTYKQHDNAWVEPD